jgi:hypothetical protein
VVGVLDGLRLAALLEVGGEAEAALGILDDAAEAAPPAERLLGGVLGLHAPEPLLQVALHPAAAPSCPARPSPPLPTATCSGPSPSLGLGVSRPSTNQARARMGPGLTLAAAGPVGDEVCGGGSREPRPRGEQEGARKLQEDDDTGGGWQGRRGGRPVARPLEPR